jgi:hypothetical protein
MEESSLKNHMDPFIGSKWPHCVGISISQTILTYRIIHKTTKVNVCIYFVDYSLESPFQDVVFKKCSRISESCKNKIPTTVEIECGFILQV